MVNFFIHRAVALNSQPYDLIAPNAQGFGFITFASARQVESATADSSHLIEGKLVRVNPAGPRPPPSDSNPLQNGACSTAAGEILDCRVVEVQERSPFIAVVKWYLQQSIGGGRGFVRKFAILVCVSA